MKNIEEKIESILVNKFGIEKHQIEANSTFANVGLDSMAIIELQYEVTNQLKIDENKISIQVEDSIYSLSNKLIELITES